MWITNEITQEGGASATGGILIVSCIFKATADSNIINVY